MRTRTYHALYHLNPMEEPMHWTERRKAKAALGLALRTRGWELYSFHEDRSDPITDYHAPASWDGVAERHGYVVVVDISPESSLLKRSGGWSTTKRVRGDDCNHCGGSGKEPDGWTLQEARANPREFNHSRAGDVRPLLSDVVNPRLFDADDDQKCTQCNGRGHAWSIEEVILPWPAFRANPPCRLWHVEKDGRILDSGVGLGPCADWDRDRATAAVERIVNRIEAAVDGYEGSTTADRQASAECVTISRNPERQGIEVVFPAKPAEEIRAELKRLGFHWSRRQALWYARFSPSLWVQIHDLLGLSEAEGPASGPDQGDSEPGEPPKPLLDEVEAYHTASARGSTPAHAGTDAPPWTMSRLAYQESRALCAGGVPILNGKDGRKHAAAVRQAVAEGLTVPADVLAEYGLAEMKVESEWSPPAAAQTAQLVLFTST
jgi:hypothetical protein